MTKPTTLPIGTLSSGTVKPDDLIPAILDALGALRLRREDRKSVVAIAAEANASDAFWTDAEAVSEAFEQLCGIAQRYTPSFCRFGMHDGDGACLGVWIDWDVIADAKHDKEIWAEADEPSGYEWWLQANDHGNVTLFRRSGNGWREVWTVV